MRFSRRTELMLTAARQCNSEQLLEMANESYSTSWAVIPGGFAFYIDPDGTHFLLKAEYLEIAQELETCWYFKPLNKDQYETITFNIPLSGTQGQAFASKGLALYQMLAPTLVCGDFTRNKFSQWLLPDIEGDMLEECRENGALVALEGGLKDNDCESDVSEDNS